MAGPFTALHPDFGPAGFAYMRRASASFEGVWLNLTLKNPGHLRTVDQGGAAALYEYVFDSDAILWSQGVIGCPSVYRLGIDTGSGSFSQSFLTNDVQNALGIPISGPGAGVDPIAGLYILPHGVIDPLEDSWADPITY